MDDSQEQEKISPEDRRWPLNAIYFYLTEGCNLKCRHCWIAPKFDAQGKSHAQLDFSLFCEVIRQAKPLGLESVKLTGGEPLLHRRIFDLIEKVNNEHLCLNIETNGVLCTPELATKIAEGKDANISVSLDGVDATTHEWVRGVKGCFDATVTGIKGLVQAGLKPQIIMSIMRFNQGQMMKMVKLAENLGAGSVKFNIVMPTCRGEDMQQRGETLSVPDLVEIGAWVEKELIPQADINVFFHHPAVFRPLSRMFDKSGNGCNVCGIKGILGVLASGAYSLCGIGVNIAELVFGNANTDRLADIWKKDEVLQAIRYGLPKRLTGICSKCLLKPICLGSCTAQNYYREKSLWAPYWYCEEAFNAGLFPKTRLNIRD